MVKRSKQYGFTLIELLIAIAIFSTIAVASYSSLINFNKASAIQQKSIQKIEKLQTLMIFIDRDFSQIFNQNLALDENKIKISSMQNDNLSDIYYDFNDEKITRIKNKFELVLLENISKPNIRVLDDSNKWFKKWKKNKDSKKYIKSIEFKFESKFGEIIKLVLIDE